MGIVGLNWGVGAALLVLLGSATAQECHQLPLTKEELKCDAGENLVYEIKYINGQHSAMCCIAGSTMEQTMKVAAKSCRTTKCAKPGVEDACGKELEGPTGTFYYKGERIFFEEVKRETCTQKDGKPGEAIYCCTKGSMESSLSTMLGAETNEFPHIALLSIEGQCGGTIYNNRFILTAAHCVVDPYTKLAKELGTAPMVKLGRNLADAPMPENDYSVLNVYPNPGYSEMKGNPEADAAAPVPYNDLALVELDRDITFGPTVKSLKLAPKGFDESKSSDKLIIAGWGRTDNDQTTKNLQKANSLIRDDDACFSQGKGTPYPMQSSRPDQFICVGGILDGVWSPTAANGDSGGPAICRGTDGTPVLCGVACAAGNLTACLATDSEDDCTPNMYTEVDHFLDWIKQIAGEQDPSTFYKPQLYGEIVSGSKMDHQVRITSVSGKSCGGTLIAPDTVVTAAHCIASGDGSGKMLSGLQVWSEVRDISSPASQGVSHSVKGVTTLDGFKMVGAPVDIAAQGNRVTETDNFYSNNLGVIKLKDSVNISPSNLPKLPGAGELASSPAQELAFPRNTSRGGELRQREYTILDKKECQGRMDRLDYQKMTSKVEDNILCGVEKYSGSSTCDRELGGGLICKGQNGKDTLCGVQVHRYCEWSIPNYFIDVSSNSDWIEAAKNQL